MGKEFLQVESIRDDAILLAEKILADNFIPTVIYVGLRGGATMGNAISEFFKLQAPPDNPPLYAAVVAHSYNKMGSQHPVVHIDGWTLEPKFLRKTDKVLFVDDIFDSGLTINAISQNILSSGVPEEHFRIAVHDYKERLFKPHNFKITPHYYSRKLVLEKPEHDDWIHYLSHELDGLTEQEIIDNYPEKIAPHLINLLNVRNKNLESQNRDT